MYEVMINLFDEKLMLSAFERKLLAKLPASPFDYVGDNLDMESDIASQAVLRAVKGLKDL